jgi:hypothetical protein
MQTEVTITGLLFTSNRSFPRSRQNPGPLIGALDQWLAAGPPTAPLTEDWLLASNDDDDSDHLTAQAPH